MCPFTLYETVSITTITFAVTCVHGFAYTHTFCSGFGRVDLLSHASLNFSDGNYNISEYSAYLPTPVVITALALVSSGDHICSVEGSLTLGVSWQEVYKAGI